MRNYKRHVSLYRRFRFGDWLVETNHPDCSLEDEAVLLRAHNVYWMAECIGLPTDEIALARLLKVSRKQLRSMLAHVDSMHIEDDKIHFHAVRHEFDAAVKQSKKQAARRAAQPGGGDHGNPADCDGGDHGDPEAPVYGATAVPPWGDQPIANSQEPEISTLEGLHGDGLRAAAGGER